MLTMITDDGWDRGNNNDIYRAAAMAIESQVAAIGYESMTHKLWWLLYPRHNAQTEHSKDLVDDNISLFHTRMPKTYARTPIATKS